MKKKIILILTLFLVAVSLLIIFFSIENIQKIKKYLSFKQIVSQDKKIIQQKYQISTLDLNQIELDFKNRQTPILVERIDDIKLSNKKVLNKHKLINGFYTGIFDYRPGGYLDFHQNNLLILSARGILGYLDSTKNFSSFKQIKNNINNFISINQFKKDINNSLRDIHIHRDKIFISFVEEIREDCWNTSVLYADINYQNINFKKLFSAKDCIHSKNNIDGDFNPAAAGGRIVNYDDNNIFLTIGEFLERYKAQDKNSVNGKIIKININNYKYELVSMGHRNPQGLLFDDENNFLIETEHGPMGGDEINLIEIDKTSKESILNYGWPISSAGEHYGGKIKKNQKKYRDYPLYKSHKNHGFVEPLKSFVPSIGISQVVKIGKNEYVLSSLGRGTKGDKSLYFFDLNDKKEIINMKRVKVFQRVRDLVFKNNKLYLFLEGPPDLSIGVISLE